MQSISRPALRSAWLLLALLAHACGDVPDVETTSDEVDSPVLLPGFAATDWTTGSLTTSLVSGPLLRALPGAMAGAPILVSNNPEIFRSNGWLVENSRRDSVRGGGPSSADKFPLYLFHINGTSTTRYLSVLITNPNSTAVTVSGKGAIYTNDERPPTGPAKSQSYSVSDAWLRGSLPIAFGPVTIQPLKAYRVVVKTMRPSNMIDGRFEITASKPVFAYTVVNTSSSLNQAIDLSQRGPASGDIVAPSPNEYGRCAGVYSGSQWVAEFPVDVPSGRAFLGLALNTNAKFAREGAVLQDQTAAARMAFLDSSERSYGNYGDEYDVGMRLRNAAAVSRTLRISFATMVTQAIPGQNFSWDGPVWLNGSVIPVYNTPTAPRQNLATITLSPGEERLVRLRFFVPGLIVQGQQLVLEAL